MALQAQEPVWAHGAGWLKHWLGRVLTYRLILSPLVWQRLEQDQANPALPELPYMGLANSELLQFLKIFL